MVYMHVYVHIVLTVLERRQYAHTASEQRIAAAITTWQKLHPPPSPTLASGAQKLADHIQREGARGRKSCVRS